MSLLWQHFLVSVAIALAWGVLIDLDHGMTNGNLRCALAWRYDNGECDQASARGFFHSPYLWAMTVFAVFVWGVHLMMDNLLGV